MAEIINYRSLVSDPGSRKFETFSYLPELDDVQLLGQVTRLVEQGLVPIIEHVEPNRAKVNYWYMWKLPMFGEKSADSVMKRLNECRDANPGHHIRLSGHNPIRQTREASFVVFRATG
jgi:ribulose-bisphosphate carboxylase small chain